MKSVLWFGVGVVVGAICVLQLRENESSCCRRVAAGVREELTDAAGPLGGVVGGVYDALNLGAAAPALLDLWGVPA